MFALYADKNRLTVQQRETMTSGSVNVYCVRFEFSADWEGLTRTAVFQAGTESRSILLDDSGACTIPWEVLTEPDVVLQAGVYGARGGDVVLPTVWARLGTVVPGTSPAPEAESPTPDLWQQELAKKGDTLAYTDSGELGLYSGDKLLSSVPMEGGGGGDVVPNIQATATTLPPDSPATVTRSGPDAAPVFDFGIPAGQPGRNGDPGEGVPPGGRPGQVLTKGSGTDYDTKWSDPGGGVTYTAGDGIDIANDVINVDNPNRGILTEAEFDALTEEQQASGTYFVDDGQDGGGNGLHIYSTEEKIVGKWVDGSNIYEKTIVVENLPNSTTWQVVDPTLKSSDVRVLVNFYGGFIPNMAKREFDPIFFISGTAQGVRVTGNIDQDGVRVINNYFNSSGTINANMTIQYVRV